AGERRARLEGGLGIALALSARIGVAGLYGAVGSNGAVAGAAAANAGAQVRSAGVISGVVADRWAGAIRHIVAQNVIGDQHAGAGVVPGNFRNVAQGRA